MLPALYCVQFPVQTTESSTVIVVAVITPLGGRLAEKKCVDVEGTSVSIQVLLCGGAVLLLPRTPCHPQMIFFWQRSRIPKDFPQFQAGRPNESPFANHRPFRFVFGYG